MWPAGAATGVGSLPGTDAAQAVKLVFDELPDLPYLPELPARGPGGAMVGRAAAILVDMPVDLQPAGWRLVPRPGLDLRRSRDLLERDLDALTEVAAGYAGPFKIAATGPWTLAAELELPRGHKALSDTGATRDIADALAAGLVEQVEQIAQRVPGARILVQFDEPSLPAVLAGRIRTPSGFSVLPAVEEGLVVERLRILLGGLRALPATGGVGVHCCAPAVPLAALRAAGVDFVGLDVTALTQAEDDAVGEIVEAGVRLMAGLVPTRPISPAAPISPTGPAAPAGAAGRAVSAAPKLSDARRTVEPVIALWSRLGFRPEQLGEVVAVTSTCGLAGLGTDDARTVMRHCRKAGRVLVDAPS